MWRKKRELRILVVNRAVFRVPLESSGGGAEKHGYQLANHLALLGHSVYFVTRTGSTAEHHSSVKVFGVPPQRGVIPPNTTFSGWVLKHLFGNLLSAMVALRIMRSKDLHLDVIHCHGPLAAFLLQRIVGWRIPVVYTMHDPSPWMAMYPRRLIRIVRKLAFLVVDVPCLRCVNHVITVGPVLREEAIRWGAPAVRVTFIPNGVSLPLVARENSTTSRYGLFVGRLEARKRVDVIIRALSRGAQNIQFVVVGDGPEKRELIHLSNDLGLGNRISFTGYVDDSVLVKYYSSASFFVFPSTAEGLPTAILEAMAYGLPVIATRTTNYDGILLHGVNSLLIDKPDAEALEGCIQNLESNRELEEKLSSSAIAAINERFSWMMVARQVGRVYEKVSMERRSSNTISELERARALRSV